MAERVYTSTRVVPFSIHVRPDEWELWLKLQAKIGAPSNSAFVRHAIREMALRYLPHETAETAFLTREKIVKITPEQWPSIATRWLNGEKAGALAREFGVTACYLQQKVSVMTGVERPRDIVREQVKTFLREHADLVTADQRRVLEVFVESDTLDDCGLKVGLTRERVRQIVAMTHVRNFEKLQERARRVHLRSLLARRFAVLLPLGWPRKVIAAAPDWAVECVDRGHVVDVTLQGSSFVFTCQACKGDAEPMRLVAGGGHVR